MNQQSRFQILSLSGGGFRGLYTAKILADLERECGAPLATKFDLLAGTSIGGILALALAQRIPASEMVDLFTRRGGEIFTKQWSLGGLLRAKYDASVLGRLLADVFGERLLGSCRHRVIVPTINYSTGKPALLKTPHHPTFKRDHTLPLVDVALATSAAPIYFRRHVLQSSQYVDGGLYANAPGLLALHEVRNFLGPVAPSSIHLLSVGTMSSVFTVNPDRNRAGGTFDWGGIWPPNAAQRVFGLSISVQESLTDFMLRHELGPDQYQLLDDPLTPDRAHAVSLDKTDSGAQEVLLGAAGERSKAALGNKEVITFLAHQPAAPTFYYGEHAVTS